MKVAIVLLASLILIWFIAAQVGNRRQRRRRQPVVEPSEACRLPNSISLPLTS